MDTTPAYELDLVVGSPITVREEEDRETYEEERAWLQEIQEALASEGVEVDLLSQPGTEVWEGGIEHFADLYQLRRLAVHLERGNDIGGVLTTNLDEEDEIDPLLADVWEGVEQTRFPHLVNHQGDGGYYLPSEFDEPIWMTDAEDVDDEDAEAISFGSSVRLVRELSELSDLLQQAGVSGGPLQALQALRAGAEQSVNHNLPLILW